ncbi:thiamine pyrophosphate-dependent enzyme [Ruminococcus sp.]|uniref:thiamine pyrophosphate-binding protein n=1 Tax=Ruminococcus sp. TaxID=41978 RepID=UPI002600B452|nr:thiamine pyrophosphate-dependent enzyme [Ruminococcus sp.]
MIFRSTSKKPIVIVGNGAREAGAAVVLHAFYEKTRIPVLTTMNAVDLVQDKEKIGFIGVYGNRVANMIVEQCDLVISIGARLGLRQIGSKKEFFAPNAFLIRADIDQYELSRNIKEDEEKHLIDAKEFIEQLMHEDIPRFDEWNTACFAAKKLLEPYDKDLGNLCIEKISSMLPENPIVAIDIGQTQCWCAQSLTLKGHNGRILIGGSYGSMGCGLPYAIGATVAQGKKTVFCITGDGGLQMNIQELQTVANEKLPIKIFVVNNKALGKIVEIQVGSYDRRMLTTTEQSGYSVPDFEKVALAYGIKSKTLDGYEGLDECVDWLSDDEPCLINIMLTEATVLQPKMNWNEREMKPLLSDDIMSQARELLA